MYDYYNNNSEILSPEFYTIYILDLVNVKP